MRFRTKNSIYYVDVQNKLVWGGKLGDNPRRYIRNSLIICERGHFLFEDGGSMTTGVIIGYF